MTATELPVLAVLDPIPKQDRPEIRRLWPADAVRHPGKMRMVLAEALVQWVVDPSRIPEGGALLTGPERVVVDPMAGIGTTGMAALRAGLSFVGCELDPRWWRVANQTILAPDAVHEYPGWAALYLGDSKTRPWSGTTFAIIMSPEFPNAKDQGQSAAQKKIRELKATNAGNEMSGRDSPWRGGRGLWTQELAEVLGPWLKNLVVGGRTLVHVKRYVKNGALVRVDDWVADAMTQLQIKVVGLIRAPLAYGGGHFQTWKKKPRHKIEFKTLDQHGAPVERLACGHWRAKNPEHLETEAGHCQECEDVPGPRVEEELVVVGVKEFDDQPLGFPT